MPETFATSAFQTILRLAEQTPVHRAFQWFHLQEPKLRAWHRSVTAIPAPPFGESARAHWLAEQFTAVGLEQVHIDDCGNTLGWLRGVASRQERPIQEASAYAPCTLLSAHLDTVFPASAIGSPMEEDSRLLSPGASDNCAGITALLAIAAAMQFAGIRPATDILFAGNVGEEGEGNLRGMRFLFQESPVVSRIRFAVVLDGAGTESVVTQALGSKRFNITVTGPGGHSWSDAGVPNPILVLANALTALGRVKLPASPRTTWNVGRIEGGTAINSVPQQVEARIDTRSTDARLLRQMEERLRETIAHAVDEANRKAGEGAGGPSTPPLRCTIEVIGERPAASLPDDACILTTLDAVDRHLGIHHQHRTASTDANIPLSLGIEAISIGSGGSGGGVHTLQEWFDARGRDLALRRILLLLLALAEKEMEI